MHKTIIFIFTLLTISCSDFPRKIRGHWHVQTRNAIELSENNPFDSPVLFYTLDISKQIGETNSNSYFLLKSDIIKSIVPNRIIVKTDSFAPMIFRYKVKKDSIYLFNKKWGINYKGERVDSIYSLGPSDHFYDGTRLVIDLPYLSDSSDIVTSNIDWRNSNYLLFGQSWRIKSFGGNLFFYLVGDDSYIGLNDLNYWYNDYVSKTYDKIRVFSDRRQSIINMKRLFIELNKLSCDSIFFAIYQNNHQTQNIDLAYIYLKDLMKFVSDSDIKALDTLDKSMKYGNKSENWVEDLTTTANTAYKQ